MLFKRESIGLSLMVVLVLVISWWVSERALIDRVDRCLQTAPTLTRAQCESIVMGGR